MRPPLFWNNPPEHPGLLAYILAPLAVIYAGLGAYRLGRPADFQADIPVICIGNLNAGGTGKTPTVIALAQRLLEMGLHPHVVSRGYGGSHAGPLLVDERQHRAAEVGDEPLLLAAFVPTWIARDRGTGVRSAQAAGANVILLDDGFQNPSVAKDLSIIVVDAKRGFGNGRVIPAGPLREPVPIGMARADLVLSIGTFTEQASLNEQWGNAITPPQIQGHLQPLPTGMDWDGLRVLAFAGIGHPEKFFATLRDLGANILRQEALDDHQPLSNPLLHRLQSEAHSLNAQLVTTEKDAVRLPQSYQQSVLTLPVRLQIDDWSAIDQAMENLGLG